MTATTPAPASPPASCKVYTDLALAAAIVRRLGDDGAASWLEPSVGPGAFLSGIACLEVPASRVTAVDIDRDVCRHRDLAQVLEGQDFVRWSLDTLQRFDRVVGNPPYVALSLVPDPLRAAALQVCTPWNHVARKKWNYWMVFVCAILRVLRSGGSLGLILPASWDYADYSQEMRERLPSLFRRFEVHRCHKPLFGGVGEGVIVLIAEGFQETPQTDQRREHPDMASLVAALDQGAEAAWVPLAPAGPLANDAARVCQLKDVADVRIGAVTGDAKYFLFDEARRQSSGMPPECFKPILSRARHIKTPEATREHWESIRDDGERAWLFAPTPQSLADRAVQAYLALPQEEGGCNRQAFKVRHREPWYSVNSPGQAHGFMSGMSVAGPFICMNSAPELTASNTLYVVEFRPHITPQDRYAWALSLLSSRSHVCVLRLLRLYADGLRKHEPKDLLRIEMPQPCKPHSLPQIKDLYQEAVCLHLRGQQADARRIADENVEVRAL